MTDQTFQMWLDSKLQKLELTRTQFAKRAGVGYQTLHPWRLNEYDPRMITLIKVCQAVAALYHQPFDMVLYEAIQTTKAYKETTTTTTTEVTK